MRMIYARQIALCVIFTVLALRNLDAQTSAKLNVKLPLQQKSIRFAVIGDSGTGDRDQYEVAQQMESYRKLVGFDFVIMLGDNIYGGHAPRDFAQKFEIPYKPLLDAGVKFYASLGNHDDPNIERLYKPFNMGGQRYHTFKKTTYSSSHLTATTWMRHSLNGSKTI
jgi:predicted MPP superfamily phosphohydrolase